MIFSLLCYVTVALVSVSSYSVDDWEAIGCFYDHDHSAIPDYFYTPSDLDFNELWPNVRPLVQACSKEAEKRNFTCFGIQFHQECWGGANASQTFNKSGAAGNCRVGVNGYGVGKLYTTFVYKLKPVDGNWTFWTEWTSCTKTCGKGFQKRTRSCTNPAPSSNGRFCDGDAIETKICLVKLCPVDGMWSPWSEWASCSQTCNNGSQKRTRNCTNPPQANNGKPCNGTAVETKICNLWLCPVNGNWTPWSEWGPCSQSCGNGFQKRMRSCTKPPPANNGKTCNGTAMETKTCNIRPCPVDGNWTSWSMWPSCSKSCGNGFQNRTRNCTNPAPANGGKLCSGDVTETRICNLKLCPVDGNWGSWCKWGPCSMSCGNGFQKRVRNCINPSPANNGKPCNGTAMETKICNTRPCPVDGQWGSWTTWSVCPVTCAGGAQKRMRSCNRPSPQNGGKPCVGVCLETRSCNHRACPGYGQWTSWSSWSRCDKTCDGGTRFRWRRCTRPPPQYNGRQCVGHGVDYEKCNTKSCHVTGNRLILCERRMARMLSCGPFRLIRIRWAHYGYVSGERVCGITHSETCSASNALNVVRGWCEGKSWCVVKSRNRYFNAPCGNKGRYLKVNYFC